MDYDKRPMLMYAICDSDGHVRYVGQCWNLGKRIRNHLWAETTVGKWLRSEVRLGRIPSAMVLMKLEPMNGIDDGIARWSAASLERFLIRHFHLKQPGELLNVAYKPSDPKPESASRYFHLPKCKRATVRWKKIVANYDSIHAVA